MAFDLTKAGLAFKETFTLELLNPVTQEPLGTEAEPVTIELYGTSSKQYRNAVTAMQNRALRRRQSKKDKETAETFREESINLLVACSAGATNLAFDGQEVGTPESFRQLYSDPRFSWIKDQVDEALGDTSNFLEQ